MTTMNEPRELLLHELGDLLFAERTIAKMLPPLIKEVTDDQMGNRLQVHLRETKEQIANLEQTFESLGERVKAEKCPGILGLQTEHDDFVKQEKPAPDILDVFDVGATMRVEHYEIAAYTSAITLAKSLGENDAVKLLSVNLKQEQKMLADTEKLGVVIGKRVMANA